MTKESLYELQRIDCNCNNCGFMVRDFEKFHQSLDDHHEWQLDYFNTIKHKLLEKAREWERRGFPEKAKPLRDEANQMKFQFNKIECRINFGNCLKFSKPVTFIPDTCQLETQHCFIHRKDYVAT